MQIDKTTLSDLSIFAHEEEHSLFHHLNFTRTYGGKEWLYFFLNAPLDSLKKILETQQTISRIIVVNAVWSPLITNGTIVVIEKFFDTPVAELPSRADFMSANTYRLFNATDFSLVRYSVKHCIDFIKGINEMRLLLSDEKNPALLRNILDRVQLLLNRPFLQKIIQQKKDPSVAEMLTVGQYMRRQFKEEMQELIETCNKLDAYFSMAKAHQAYQLHFPDFIETDEPFLLAEDLYHPLLTNAVSYNISFEKNKNFLFLTGANMGGKSTFIKAVGIGVYLAHIGMSVPAKNMQLSFFDGMLSNINVVDNIIQGESYFYNEVQRIKKTIEKINDEKKWLILIDELFKGTNVQDAMKCSSTVIEGLRKISNAVFILSTHLYEIGDALKKYSNIQFKYFETEIKNDELVFSYQLKEGISNDRLGYLILKREGVVEMLEKL